jgi:hypothetical protein
MVSQLGTAKIKGGGYEMLVGIVTVASSLSSTQEVISCVQIIETTVIVHGFFQHRIHKRTSVDFNRLVK